MNLHDINFSEADKLHLKSAINIIKKEYGDNLIGLYLFGSAVQGGLKKNSDLDILTITKTSLLLETRKRLTKNLMKVSKKINDTSNKRYIELTNLTEGDIVPWHHPASHDFQYGEWLRSDFENGVVPTRELSSDLTIVLYQAKEHHICLMENSVDLPNISKGDLKKGMEDVLPDIINDIEGDESNVILTLCRMQYTNQHNLVISKDEAGDYMKNRVNEKEQQLIYTATNEYLSGIKGEYDKKELSELIKKLSILNE